MEKLTRRTFLKIAGAGAVALSPLGDQFTKETLQPPTVLAKSPTLDEIKSEIILHAHKVGLPDITGYRLSEVWEDENGEHNVAYQSVVFKRNHEGLIVPRKVLDELHLRGKDNDLRDGKLGVIIPPRIKDKTPHEVSDEFEQKIKDIKLPPFIDKYVEHIKPNLDPGILTAPILEVGPFTIARFQAGAYQKIKDEDRVVPVLVGEAAKHLSLVPQGFSLDTPTDDKEFIVSSSLPFNGMGIDQIISFAAKEMGISESYARKIVACESSFNPNALNPSGASGLWQIMPLHAGRFQARGWNFWTDRFDPYKNTVIAIEIMKESGVRAWECR